VANIKLDITLPVRDAVASLANDEPTRFSDGDTHSIISAEQFCSIGGMTIEVN
jgi:hypothetical protein